MIGRTAAALVVVLLLVAAPASAQIRWKQINWTNVAIGAFAISQATDLATTEFCIGRGSCEEANPLFRPFQNRPIAMGVAKGAGAVFVGDVLLRQRQAHPKRTALIAAGLAGAYVGLSIRNARYAPGGRR